MGRESGWNRTPAHETVMRSSPLAAQIGYVLASCRTLSSSTHSSMHCSALPNKCDLGDAGQPRRSVKRCVSLLRIRTVPSRFSPDSASCSILRPCFALTHCETFCFQTNRGLNSPPFPCQVDSARRTLAFRLLRSRLRQRGILRPHQPHVTSRPCFPLAWDARTSHRSWSRCSMRRKRPSTALKWRCHIDVVTL